MESGFNSKLYRNILKLNIIISSAFWISANGWASYVKPEEAPPCQVGRLKSSLLEGFSRAIEKYSNSGLKGPAVTLSPEGLDVGLWTNAFKLKGVSPEYVRKRLTRSKSAPKSWGSQVTSHFIINNFSSMPCTISNGQIGAESNIPVPILNDQPLPIPLAYPVALHAFKIEVDEDYDDLLNDRLFIYSVTTFGDIQWGKVSSIYSNLDERTQAILSPNDQGLFDPKGRIHNLDKPLIVDIGIIESDGEDSEELARLTGVIIDLAESVLAATDSSLAIQPGRLRAETQNLVDLLMSMDENDRMGTTSISLDPISVGQMLRDRRYVEWFEEFSGNRRMSAFRYRLWFRLLSE